MTARFVGAAEIVALIEAHRFDCSTEDSLQQGLAELFDGRGIPYHRESRLNSHDRLDFLLATGLGVEVKIDGSLSTLVRQLHRYAQSGKVTALLVVTAKVQLARVPTTLNGKPIHVAALLRGVF